MTGPDLTYAQAQYEALMDDTCRITVDDAGRGDDVLDEATGELGQSGLPAALYEGPCLLSTGNAQPNGTTPYDVPAEAEPVTAYVLSLPLSAPEVRPGCVVLMLTSRRDPLEPQRKFVAKDRGEVGTFAIARDVPVEAI